jgi:hypothetical protein
VSDASGLRRWLKGMLNHRLERINAVGVPTIVHRWSGLVIIVYAGRKLGRPLA